MDMASSNGRIMRLRNTSGFTLIEVMIALAVFAIVAAALVKNAALTVKQTRIIEEKSIAYWVAENRLAELRAKPKNDENFPQTGTNTDTVKMAGRSWDVTVDVASTDNKYMRRVKVSVAASQNSDQQVASLVGFLGRY